MQSDHCDAQGGGDNYLDTSSPNAAISFMSTTCCLDEDASAYRRDIRLCLSWKGFRQDPCDLSPRADRWLLAFLVASSPRCC